VATIGEFSLVEATDLTPGVWGGTITARATDGSFVDFKANTFTGEKTRSRLAELLSPYTLNWLVLEHGSHLAQLDSLSISGQHLPGDACLLTCPGNAVAFTTADCVPLIISCQDTASQPLALAIHAGWRSIADGVIEKAITVLLARSGNNPTSLRAWIGPAIEQSHYEIDDNTRLLLLNRINNSANAESCFQANRPGHWLADLDQIVELILIGTGLSPRKIKGSGLGTFENTAMHSARRDGENAGRMATFVVLGM
jgi:YfiH family protein